MAATAAAAGATLPAQLPPSLLRLLLHRRRRQPCPMRSCTHSCLVGQRLLHMHRRLEALCQLPVQMHRALQQLSRASLAGDELTGKPRPQLSMALLQLLPQTPLTARPRRRRTVLPAASLLPLRSLLLLAHLTAATLAALLAVAHRVARLLCLSQRKPSPTLPPPLR